MNRNAGYSFQVVSVTEAVENAVAGQWDVPEFQREFVWRPSQVCGLADSLWRNYPIGPVLLWRAWKYGPGESSLWIADGQQRLTALSLLCGGAPSWFRRRPEEFRARMTRQFDIRFDISARNRPRFVAVDPSHKGSNDPRLIPTARLMAIDPGSQRGRKELARLAMEVKDAGYIPAPHTADLYRQLLRVSMMRGHQVVATVLSHQQRDDVLEDLRTPQQPRYAFSQTAAEADDGRNFRRHSRHERTMPALIRGAQKQN